MSHHVFHVAGSGVDAAPQLVVQQEDLLTVRPADGSSGPIASRVAGSVLTRFPLVAAQKLPELLGVREEEGGRVPDTQQQEGEGEDREPGHGGSTGHFDTSAVWVGLSDYSKRRIVCERRSSESQTQPARRKYFNESFPAV